MPIYWIAVLFFGISLGAISTLTRETDLRSSAADASAIAHNLLVYRNALAEFANSNPGYAGTVPDSSLSLPPWFVHLPGVNGYVAAANSYAFYASPPVGLVTQLLDLTGSSRAVGYVSAGQLISPIDGAAGIAVPGTVPNGSAVVYR